MGKKLLIVVAAIAVSLGLSQSASAHNNQWPPREPETVEICHVNRWDTAQPYTKQTVNIAQYLAHYFVDFRPYVPTSEAEAIQLKADRKFWGDIMPEFRGYFGRNLTAGQAILDNDCSYVTGGSGGVDPEPEPEPTDPGTPVVAQVAAPTRTLVAAGGTTPAKAALGFVGVVASIGALGYGVTKLRKA